MLQPPRSAITRRAGTAAPYLAVEQLEACSVEKHDPWTNRLPNPTDRTTRPYLWTSVASPRPHGRVERSEHASSVSKNTSTRSSSSGGKPPTHRAAGRGLAMEPRLERSHAVARHGNSATLTNKEAARGTQF